MIGRECCRLGGGGGAGGGGGWVVSLVTPFIVSLESPEVLGGDGPYILGSRWCTRQAGARTWCTEEGGARRRCTREGGTHGIRCTGRVVHTGCGVHRMFRFIQRCTHTHTLQHVHGTAMHKPQNTTQPRCTTALMMGEGRHRWVSGCTAR